jgi:hypothetical protein
VKVLDNDPSRYMQPQVAVNTGELGMVYPAASSGELRFSRVSFAGLPIGTPLVLEDTVGAKEYRIARLGADYAVAWSVDDSAAGLTYVRFARVSATGALSGPVRLLAGVDTFRDLGLAVFGERVAVTWNVYELGHDIHVSVLSPTGETLVDGALLWNNTGHQFDVASHPEGFGVFASGTGSDLYAFARMCPE